MILKSVVIFTIFLGYLHCFDTKFEELNDKDFPNIILLTGYYDYDGDIITKRFAAKDLEKFDKKKVDVPCESRKYHYYSYDINAVVTKCFDELLSKIGDNEFVLYCNGYILLKEGTQEDIGDDYKGKIGDSNFRTFYFVPKELGFFEDNLILFYNAKDKCFRIFRENKGYRIYFLSDVEFKCIPFSLVSRVRYIYNKGLDSLNDKVDEIEFNDFKINNKAQPIIPRPPINVTVPSLEKKNQLNIDKGKGNGSEACCCS